MNYWDPRYEPSTEPALALPELSDEDVKVALANIQNYLGLPPSQLGNQNVQLISYEAKHADVPKSNYLRTYEFKINFQLSNENHQFKSILKLQNHQISHNRISMSHRHLFLKEILIYGCVIPKMREFMPSNQNQLPVPACYLAKSDDQSLYNASQTSPCCFLPGSVDILILEDVRREGYRPANKYFNLAELKLATKSLAELHAMSVVLNRRGSSHNLSITQIFPALTEETLFNKHANPIWYEQFTAAIEIFSVIGPMMNEEVLLPGRDISEVVKVMMKELWDILEDTLKPSATYVNALCLNNFDKNVFTFAYVDHETPKRCKITDFQHVKYSRPIIDLVQLLYNRTEMELKKDNLNYIIEYYHDAFLDTINKCHLKYHTTLPLPSGLLSLAELKETYNECKLLGCARRALITSFACMIEYDPYSSFERGHNVSFAAEEWLSRQTNLPPRSELTKLAKQAFKENPHYRVAMYHTMSELCECLAERINCQRVDPHIMCPHPNTI